MYKRQGLCVDALGGAPGVQSADYAPLGEEEQDAPGRPVSTSSPSASSALATPRERRRLLQDAANNAKLLKALADLGPDAPRHAAFVCTLVAVRHAEDPEPIVAVGRWSGRIALSAAGGGGFGYDPLMHISSLGCSVAELDAATKNRESHRARAAAVLVERLRTDWRLG